MDGENQHCPGTGISEVLQQCNCVAFIDPSDTHTHTHRNTHAHTDTHTDTHTHTHTQHTHKHTHTDTHANNTHTMSIET